MDGASADLRPGDRVRLSPEAVRGCVGGYTSPRWLGTVIRAVRRRRAWGGRSRDAVAVRWDGTATAMVYGAGWLDRVNAAPVGMFDGPRPALIGVRCLFEILPDWPMSVSPRRDDGDPEEGATMRDMDRREKASLDRWLTDEERVRVEPVTMAPDELVDRLVTDEERAQCLLRLSVLNGGRTEGIHLRDALAIMFDSDAMLTKTEDAADEWRTLWPDDAWTPAHSMAVYVLSMLDRATTAENVRRFMHRMIVRFDDDGYAVVGVERLDGEKPKLGLATTRELLREVEARMVTHPRRATPGTGDKIRIAQWYTERSLAVLDDETLDYSTVSEGRL